MRSFQIQRSDAHTTPMVLDGDRELQQLVTLVDIQQRQVKNMVKAMVLISHLSRTPHGKIGNDGIDGMQKMIRNKLMLEHSSVRMPLLRL